MARKPRQPSVSAGREWDQPGPVYNFPFDSDHFEAIGRVIVQWSHLEYQLDRELAFLNCCEENGNEYTSHSGSLSPRLKKLRELAGNFFTDKSVLGRLMSILDRASSLSVERDIMAHGIWYPTSDNRYNVTQTRFGKVPKYRGLSYSKEKILDLADRIGRVNFDLYRWTTNDWPDPPPIKVASPTNDRFKSEATNANTTRWRAIKTVQRGVIRLTGDETDEQ